VTPATLSPMHTAWSSPASGFDELTERELEILGLMAEGCSNAAISETLWLSLRTVEAHVRSILLKLCLLPAPGVHRRVLAVLAYLAQSEDSALLHTQSDLRSCA
jgi:DNA-binding NarL/FixJ family response regulator